MDDCPCMDKSENYVQPHMPVTGEDEVCQCIDNAYTCVPNEVQELRKCLLYYYLSRFHLEITLLIFNKIVFYFILLRKIAYVLATTPAEDEHEPDFLPSTIVPHLKCEPERLVSIVALK